MLDGDAFTVSGMDTSAGASYWITKKRIYRINQGSSGAVYQFVVEIPIAQASYVDEILDADLGEELATTEWDGPPAGIKGVIALPNGVLAGFVDNLVCFSVPKYPHAWPASYQKATDRNVVALGAYGNNVVVVTEGQPYIVVGNDPANLVMERVDLGHSCMSKRGAVDMGEVIIYPSPQGLAAIGPGMSELLTREIMTADQWVARYNPTTILAYYWQGKYVAFYTSAGGTQAGFIFDPVTRDLLDLDFYATAGFHDKTNGTLYLMVGSNIVSFADASTYRTLNYLSKPFRYLPTCLGAGKVLANSYPVLVDVIYRDIPNTDVLSVTSSAAFRLANMGLTEKAEVRIRGTSQVTAVFLATTMEELAELST